MSDSQTDVCIHYLDASGEKRTVNAVIGESLMQAAKKNNIEGIDADCGGAASCGTCQIIIPEDFNLSILPPSDNETDMLEFVGSGERGVRLACQIPAGLHLNGMTVRVVGS